DNLSSHKVAGVRGAIERCGAALVYLPPYSPDLNPIEKAFAKLKSLLRKLAARTVRRLWDALGDLLHCFTPQECANYLASAGYGSLIRDTLLIILIDAEEALGRNPRLPGISKCIVDVGDAVNLYVTVHVAVPVNMNIRADLPDLLLQQIRSQHGIKNSITLG